MTSFESRGQFLFLLSNLYATDRAARQLDTCSVQNQRPSEILTIYSGKSLVTVFLSTLRSVFFKTASQEDF
jgi:hypothetical protein